jgi:hypothetical protein
MMRRAFALVLSAACGGARTSGPAPQAPEAVSPASTTSSPVANETEPLVEQSVTVWGNPGKEPPTLPPCTGRFCDYTSVSGSLPNDTIVRIIHLNRARFRSCYATGVRRNPSLAGRVAVRFVIRRSGAVDKVAIDPSSTLIDAELDSCLVDAFALLSFPQPEGGEVGVLYPMVFTPAR